MKIRIVALALGAGLGFTSVAFGQIGETGACPPHMDQAAIESWNLQFDAIFEQGRVLFDARFNFLDGRGRPFSLGNGNPRATPGPAFIRTSGPDATSCFGCHNQPRSGAGGDIVANVFVLAQNLDSVTTSIDPHFSNERNTLGMMGSGPIEMLAREMTAELQAIRERAKKQAAQGGQPVIAALVAKGVKFGSIIVRPDGKIDPSQIQGVDWDLIIKPFHQKGAVVSLREFTNNAMNHHHGMQSVERFGLNTDPDGDGVMNELSVGDITACTIYQAALGTPVQVMPTETKRRDAVKKGGTLFASMGCTQCHVSALTLSSPYFVEPNPYNPPGNLRPNDVSQSYRFDMTSQGEGPYLERTYNGGALVRAFTDLKRHDLNDADLNFFANELVPQGTINGFAPPSDFTMAPYPRPTRQFLTRKLWDAGNGAPYGHRGDLSTLTEAIYYHGGEARATRDAFFARPKFDQDCVIEFLKSLQVVPPPAH